ncbi:MAG: copper chaperone PCu(A)C [Chloroflexi bacterium]|nr:copper chaperone PCu(A)C [Chloroflexota bacterium]
MKQILLILGFILLALAACAPGKFAVSEPWARPALANGTGAAYFVIENPAAQPDALINATSDVAGIVELHKTVMAQGDVMQMMKMERIVIPANSKTEFKPGGSHIMLINLKRELKTGDTFALTLRFENAGEVVLQVKVQER